MPSITKVLSEEVALSTANTVFDATLVRIFSPDESLITVEDDVGVIGSFTMPPNSKEFVEKSPTDTISASNTVFTSAVAFTA